MIRLHLNENRWLRESPLAQSVQVAASNLADYPDATYQAARVALSEHLALDPDQIVLGNGSTELIHAFFQSIAARGGRIVYPWPSYVLYKELGDAWPGQTTRVVDPSPWQQSLASLAAWSPGVALIIVCNPNNPTGQAFRRTEIEALLASVPESTFVLVDEAYIDFADDPSVATAVRLLGDFPNLVVTRTLSKVCGFAGLRIGYAIASPPALRVLLSALPHWNVSALAVSGLLASINQQAAIAEAVEGIRAERTRLSDRLKKFDLTVFPSSGNFVTFTDPEAPALVTQLAAAGILVRLLNDFGLPNAVRVTIGLPNENDALLSALGSLWTSSKALAAT